MSPHKKFNIRNRSDLGRVLESSYQSSKENEKTSKMEHLNAGMSSLRVQDDVGACKIGPKEEPEGFHIHSVFKFDSDSVQSNRVMDKTANASKPRRAFGQRCPLCGDMYHGMYECKLYLEAGDEQPECKEQQNSRAYSNGTTIRSFLKCPLCEEDHVVNKCPLYLEAQQEDKQNQGKEQKSRVNPSTCMKLGFSLKCPLCDDGSRHDMYKCPLFLQAEKDQKEYERQLDEEERKSKLKNGNLINQEFSRCSLCNERHDMSKCPIFLEGEKEQRAFDQQHHGKQQKPKIKSTLEFSTDKPCPLCNNGSKHDVYSCPTFQNAEKYFESKSMNQKIFPKCPLCDDGSRHDMYKCPLFLQADKEQSEYERQLDEEERKSKSRNSNSNQEFSRCPLCDQCHDMKKCPIFLQGEKEQRLFDQHHEKQEKPQSKVTLEFAPDKLCGLCNDCSKHDDDVYSCPVMQNAAKYFESKSMSQEIFPRCLMCNDGSRHDVYKCPLFLQANKEQKEYERQLRREEEQLKSINLGKQQKSKSKVTLEFSPDKSCPLCDDGSKHDVYSCPAFQNAEKYFELKSMNQEAFPKCELCDDGSRHDMYKCPLFLQADKTQKEYERQLCREEQESKSMNHGIFPRCPFCDDGTRHDMYECPLFLQAEKAQEDYERQLRTKELKSRANPNESIKQWSLRCPLCDERHEMFKCPIFLEGVKEQKAYDQQKRQRQQTSSGAIGSKNAGHFFKCPLCDDGSRHDMYECPLFLQAEKDQKDYDRKWCEKERKSKAAGGSNAGFMKCTYCNDYSHTDYECPFFLKTDRKQKEEDKKNRGKKNNFKVDYTGGNSQWPAPPKPDNSKKCRVCNDVGHNEKTCPIFQKFKRGPKDIGRKSRGHK